ncbi:MAG: helix-turn-helix domain-containing protein [Nanoarchaeota archaeon]|nr:helix-turn-helix domain-containing protein [Nanoarchaeota archaeon]MBU1103938.1 helix-turn-helix domain-containing protein [Nanoarchaeota archaeon]
MQEEILKCLVDFGLKNKEAEVFLCLVGKNKLTAYEIAKQLSLFRSTTYEILNRLVEKGFVTQSKIGKTSFFKPNEISSVVSKLKSKEDILVSLIPKLNQIKSDKPETRILEGTLGQKQYNFELIDIIKRKQIDELYMIGNSVPEKESSLLFLEKIINEIQKLKPKKYGIFKGIWSSKYKNSKFVKHYDKFGENRFLSKVPSKVTTFITNNFIGFFFEENEIPYVIEVKSKNIANEMKSYFETMWKLAKK